MFEYRLTAGVHHVWQLSRDGAVLNDELQTLSEVEDAVDDAVDSYCREHGVTVSLVRGGDGRRDVTMTHGAALSFTWVVVALECRCEDCGADTWDETYKVDEVLWATAGDPSGFLCIGCLGATGPGPDSRRLRRRRTRRTGPPSDVAPTTTKTRTPATSAARHNLPRTDRVGRPARIQRSRRGI